MSQYKWTFAVMKEDMLPFVRGEKIVIGKSTLEFTHPTMGNGYWILSTVEERCLLVADGDASMGNRLSRLVRWERPVPDDKQDKCTARAKALMPDSAYHPRNRKWMTYFFGGRPSNKQKEHFNG